MRIAYIINSVEGGGAASPVPAITQVMRQHGAQVRVLALTRRDGRALPPMVDAGLDPVVRDGGEHDHLAALRWLNTETRHWGATHLWTSLSRATILGLLLSRWRHLPAVCWQHNVYLKSGNLRLLRMLRKQAALWVADSDAVAMLTAHRLRVGSDRLVTWPIFSADPSAPTARPWQAGQPICVGSLGRLHRAKGYDILMAALAILDAAGFQPPAPVRFTIAGEGAEREHIEAMARGVNVASFFMPGYATAPQDFLASQHLYIQPSRVEGFCIAVHEAMSAGLPILASAVGQIGHTIRNDIEGSLVQPENPQALAAALHRLLSRPDQLHGMGNAARKRVMEQYSHARFVATGTAILDRIAR